MKDKFGRKIDYVRISLTDKCNLRCVYCMPDDVKFEKNYINNDLSFDDYKFIIKGLADIGITKVRFTGGEPLLYPKLLELIKYTYLAGIDDIAITTNGIGLYEIASELRCNGLSTVNISMDSLKEYKFKEITRYGQLINVLKSINKCLRLGIKVKINCVLIDGFNDDEIIDFITLTMNYPIDVRFIELMPLGEAKKIYHSGYIDVVEAISNVEGLYRIKDEKKSVAKYYKLQNSKGRVGIITPMSCSFCSDCNRIRLTSDGFIKPCLHSKEEIDIKYYLNKPMIFREILKEIILGKPEKHYLVENQSTDTDKSMYQIGG